MRDSANSGLNRAQGSTFLWVEGYGRPVSRVVAATGLARDAAFAFALLVMAHGAAYFVALERF